MVEGWGLECYINQDSLALVIIYYDFLCRVDPTYIKLYSKDYQFKSSYAALKGCNYVLVRHSFPLVMFMDIIE